MEFVKNVAVVYMFRWNTALRSDFGTTSDECIRSARRNMVCRCTVRKQDEMKNKTFRTRKLC